MPTSHASPMTGAKFTSVIRHIYVYIHTYIYLYGERQESGVEAFSTAGEQDFHLNK